MNFELLNFLGFYKLVWVFFKKGYFGLNFVKFWLCFLGNFVEFLKNVKC